MAQGLLDVLVDNWPTIVLAGVTSYVLWYFALWFFDRREVIFRMTHWRGRRRMTRPLSYSEQMLQNFKEVHGQGSGPLNMSILLTLAQPLDPESIRTAINTLYDQHAVLRSRVVAEQAQVVVLDDAAESAEQARRRLSFLVDERSELTDAQILEEEVNTAMNGTILRCRLVVPTAEREDEPEEDEGRLSKDGLLAWLSKEPHNKRATPSHQQRLAVTVDHILLDGPSVALLTKELIALARTSNTNNNSSVNNASIINNNNNKSMVNLPPPSNQTLSPSEMPTSSDVWLPNLPLALLAVLAFSEFLVRSRCLVPRIRFLPLSNPDPPFERRSTDGQLRWQTLLELRSLCAMTADKLTARCREHRTTIGALFACVSCAVVARLAVEHEKKDDGYVWLHMTVDLRRFADQVSAQMNDELLGHHAVFLIDTMMSARQLCLAAQSPAAFWQLARHQKNKFAANFSRRRHLANHVIAGCTRWKQKSLLRNYLRSKVQPPGGGVSLSNLGMICPSPSPSPPQGTPSPSSSSTIPERQYLFSSVQELEGYGLADVRGAVTQSMPSRHVCITSATVQGRMHFSFSFPDFSISRPAAQEYADKFIELLVSLVQ